MHTHTRTHTRARPNNPHEQSALGAAHRPRRGDGNELGGTCNRPRACPPTRTALEVEVVLGVHVAGLRPVCALRVAPDLDLKQACAGATNEVSGSVREWRVAAVR